MTLPKNETPTRLRDAGCAGVGQSGGGRCAATPSQHKAAGYQPTNAGAKALRCTRCHKAAERLYTWCGICDDCWQDINYPEETLYQKRKSWSTAKAVLIAFVLAFGLATDAHPWTLVAKGLVVANQTPVNGPGPFGDDLLLGLPYTMTITTDPELNGLVEQDDANTHITRGSLLNENIPSAPYTLRLTVNGKELVQTEPYPSYNRSILQAHPVTFEHSIVQSVRSNGCSWTYGLCIMADIIAGSMETFLSSLDFDRQALKLNGKIFIFDDTRVAFQFRNGPIAQQSIQAYTYFYGSITSLTVKVDR